MRPTATLPTIEGMTLAQLELAWSSAARAPTTPMTPIPTRAAVEPVLGQAPQPRRDQHDDEQRADDQHELVVGGEGADGPVLHARGDVVDDPLPHRDHRVPPLPRESGHELRDAEPGGEGEHAGQGTMDATGALRRDGGDAHDTRTYDLAHRFRAREAT